MFKIPKRPFKIFNDYIVWVRTNNRYRKQYPCSNCDGYGRYRRQEDHDPHEGWKLADWFTCPVCNGTGEGNPAEYKEKYESIIFNWREDVKYLHAKNKALKKLTKNEQQLLGIRTY